jgi:uncharacterized protein (TIGR03435 family)
MRTDNSEQLTVLRRGAVIKLVVLMLSVTLPAADAQLLPGQTFAVASIKIKKSNERSRINAVPAAGRLAITGMTVKEVIEGAYGIQAFQLISNGSPVLNERIDIEAKTEPPVASVAQTQQMLQPLLAERFGLRVHRDQREMSALVLVLVNKDGRLGPKMKKSENQCDALGTGVTRFVMANPSASSDQPICGFLPGGVGRIVGKGLDMAAIAGTLAPSQRMPVVDETRLQGRYDIDLTYTPEPFSATALAQRGGAPMPGVDPNGASLFQAIEEQLGLKLQPKRMLVPVVVIDHIEPLTEN